VVDVAADLLAIAELAAPGGWVLKAVTITSDIVGAAGDLQTCAGAIRSADCYAVIGGIAPSALGVHLPGDKEAEEIASVGAFLVEDVSEVADLVEELAGGSSSSSSSGTVASGGLQVAGRLRPSGHRTAEWDQVGTPSVDVLDGYRRFGGSLVPAGVHHVGDGVVGTDLAEALVERHGDHVVVVIAG
jgi:hypothetical protein